MYFETIIIDASGTGPGSAYCSNGSPIFPDGYCNCRFIVTPTGPARAPIGGCCSSSLQCESGNCVDYTCVEPVTTTNCAPQAPGSVTLGNCCNDNNDCVVCKCVRDVQFF